ncbi:uncharacterized protein SCHCODRAFT_02571606 [Schizophyllum commune H4-8]|nr:uncharacterized protein SCHCODRAFT_02571606 [Schizophyllum commune H4-8]KAI5894796.1 hypothetical protein SCHCODRAFT_02571606 [Schizophyllum commune H4-8]
MRKELEILCGRHRITRASTRPTLQTAVPLCIPTSYYLSQTLVRPPLEIYTPPPVEAHTPPPADVHTPLPLKYYSTASPSFRQSAERCPPPRGPANVVIALYLLWTKAATSCRRRCRAGQAHVLPPQSSDLEPPCIFARTQDRLTSNGQRAQMGPLMSMDRLAAPYSRRAPPTGRYAPPTGRPTPTTESTRHDLSSRHDDRTRTDLASTRTDLSSSRHDPSNTLSDLSLSINAAFARLSLQDDASDDYAAPDARPTLHPREIVPRPSSIIASTGSAIGHFRSFEQSPFLAPSVYPPAPYTYPPAPLERTNPLLRQAAPSKPRRPATPSDPRRQVAPSSLSGRLAPPEPSRNVASSEASAINICRRQLNALRRAATKFAPHNAIPPSPVGATPRFAAPHSPPFAPSSAPLVPSSAPLLPPSGLPKPSPASPQNSPNSSVEIIQSDNSLSSLGSW